jgi:hypothetical protein
MKRRGNKSFAAPFAMCLELKKFRVRFSVTWAFSAKSGMQLVRLPNNTIGLTLTVNQDGDRSYRGP